MSQKITEIFKRCKNIEDLIIITENLSNMGLQSPERNGDEISALCPFHSEKNRSFYLNVVSGKFFCQACHKRGWIHMLIHQLNPSINEKLCYYLCESLSGKKSKLKQYKVLKDYDYYTEKARNSKLEINTKTEIKILDKRVDYDYIISSRKGNISKKEIDDYGLHRISYSINGSQTKDGIMIPSGICPTPEKDIENDLFQIRTTDKMKYLNKFNVHSTLGLINRSIKSMNRTIVVTEGMFDSIRLSTLSGGELNCCPCWSSHLSDEQIGMILMVADRVLFSFDNDDAGISAMRKINKLELKKLTGLQIGFYFKPKGDWGDATKEDVKKVIEHMEDIWKI